MKKCLRALCLLPLCGLALAGSVEISDPSLLTMATPMSGPGGAVCQGISFTLPSSSNIPKNTAAFALPRILFATGSISNNACTGTVDQFSDFDTCIGGGGTQLPERTGQTYCISTSNLNRLQAMTGASTKDTCLELVDEAVGTSSAQLITYSGNSYLFKGPAPATVSLGASIACDNPV